MSFSSAPTRALTAEDAEFAEDFLVFGLLTNWVSLPVARDTDFRPLFLFSPVSPVPPVVKDFRLLLPAPSASSAVKAFRFASARAIASASQGAFTFPRDAERLLFHSAEPLSPAISAMVRPVRMEVSYASMSNPATT